jgi:DNA-binding GntR family transcriptional regulator
MRDSVDRMAVAEDFDDYRRADIRFHMAIAEASGAPRLVGLVGEIEAEVSELIAHIAHPPEVLDHSNAEHARMIEALERRDTARAVRLLRRHLDGTVHILGGLFPPGHA